RPHQPGSSDASALPLHHFRSAQGQVQILLRAFALETQPPILQGKLLKPPGGKEKARVINGDERVAAAAVLHSPSYDPRKRVISAASDEGVEKVMRKIVIAIQFDQHRIAGSHVRDRDLRGESFDVRL